jgi:hypothetical protein
LTLLTILGVEYTVQTILSRYVPQPEQGDSFVSALHNIAFALVAFTGIAYILKHGRFYTDEPSRKV